MQISRDVGGKRHGFSTRSQPMAGLDLTALQSCGDPEDTPTLQNVTQLTNRQSWLSALFHPDNLPPDRPRRFTRVRGVPPLCNVA